MKLIPILASGLLLAATAAAQQSPQLPLDFPELEKKATDVVNVSLPKSLLDLAARFIPNDEPDSAKIKKLVSNLQGIFVRSYEFDKDGEFSPRDLDPIRKIITGTGWICLVSVHSKRNGEDTDVCLRQDGDKVLGLAVVSTEPRKFTVVNVLGAISPEDFALLKEFGVPEIVKLDKGKSKEKEKEKEKDDKVKGKEKDKEKDKDKEKEKDKEVLDNDLPN
jgi:hypothetical protein